MEEENKRGDMIMEEFLKIVYYARLIVSTLFNNLLFWFGCETSIRGLTILSLMMQETQLEEKHDALQRSKDQIMDDCAYQIDQAIYQTHLKLTKLDQLHNKETDNLVNNDDLKDKSLRFEQETSQLPRFELISMENAELKSCCYESHVQTNLKYEELNSSLKQENEEIREMLQKVQSSLESYKSSLQHFEMAYSELLDEKIELSAKNSKADDETQTYSYLEDKCWRLEIQLSEMESDYESQVQTTLKYKKLNSNLKKTNKKMHNKLQKGQSSLESYRLSLEDFKTTCSELMDQKFELSAKANDETTKSLQNLKDKCTKLKIEKTQLRCERNLNMAINDDLEDICTRLDEEKDQLLNDLTSMKTIHEELERNFTKLEDEKSQLQKDKASIEDMNNKLREELTELKIKYAASAIQNINQFDNLESNDLVVVNLDDLDT